MTKFKRNMTALHMKYKTTTAEKEKKRKETDKQRKKMNHTW